MFQPLCMAMFCTLNKPLKCAYHCVIDITNHIIWHSTYKQQTPWCWFPNCYSTTSIKAITTIPKKWKYPIFSRRWWQRYFPYHHTIYWLFFITVSANINTTLLHPMLPSGGDQPSILACCIHFLCTHQHCSSVSSILSTSLQFQNSAFECSYQFLHNGSPIILFLTMPES